MFGLYAGTAGADSDQQNAISIVAQADAIYAKVLAPAGMKLAVYESAAEGLKRGNPWTVELATQFLQAVQQLSEKVASGEVKFEQPAPGESPPPSVVDAVKALVTQANSVYKQMAAKGLLTESEYMAITTHIKGDGPWRMKTAQALLDEMQAKAATNTPGLSTPRDSASVTPAKAGMGLGAAILVLLALWWWSSNRKKSV